MTDDTAHVERALIEATEREQRNLGQQLHDTLCQSLSGIGIVARVLARRVGAGDPIDPAQLHELGKMTDHALDEARALSRKLHPVQPEACGLMSALEELAQTTAPVIPCQFRCEKPILVDDAKAAVALYRIAEEAVRNSVLHSGADRTTIFLREIDGRTTLEVHDNGRGYTPTVSSSHVTGTELMRCRAKAVGADLAIESESGNGTTVRCTLRAEQG